MYYDYYYLKWQNDAPVNWLRVKKKNYSIHLKYSCTLTIVKHSDVTRRKFIIFKFFFFTVHLLSA